MADEKRLELSGRIDSANAAQVERALAEKLAGERPEVLTLDLAKLSYISSAGIRILRKLQMVLSTSAPRSTRSWR